MEMKKGIIYLGALVGSVGCALACYTGGCNPPPSVPEFSFIAAGIAVAGAGIGFLVLRRKH